MESEIPKQFLNVAGKPVLMHTISHFNLFAEELHVRLVLPKPYIDFWKSLCKRYDFNQQHEIIEGGEARFYSVKNGIADLPEDSLIGIHDGVRPLVSMQTIRNAFNSAAKHGSGIPVIKINESLRHVSDSGSKPVNRKEYKLVQTPQCFQSRILMKAYKQDYDKSFTDDASVVEAMGEKIRLVDGNYENIKITRPVDLKIAEVFLK